MQNSHQKAEIFRSNGKETETNEDAVSFQLCQEKNKDQDGEIATDEVALPENDKEIVDEKLPASAGGEQIKTKKRRRKAIQQKLQEKTEQVPEAEAVPEKTDQGAQEEANPTTAPDSNPPHADDKPDGKNDDEDKKKASAELKKKKIAEQQAAKKERYDFQPLSDLAYFEKIVFQPSLQAYLLCKPDQYL